VLQARERVVRFWGRIRTWAGTLASRSRGTGCLWTGCKVQKHRIGGALAVVAQVLSVYAVFTTYLRNYKILYKIVDVSSY